MPSKPSRSEIESAVAATRKPSVRQKKVGLSNGSNLNSQTRQPRQQKVIGGDLAGVSKNSSNSGILSRIRKVNSVNWIAIAIVLSIFAVFFSPQPEKQQTIEMVSQVEDAVESVYSAESRVDQAPVVQEQQSFLRTTDIERAIVFREQEILDKKIALLLADAKEHMANSEFSVPEGNNAVIAYNTILQLAPANSAARRGIQTINEIYLEKGYQALDRNALSAAEVVLEKLLTIDSQSNETGEFADALSRWKTAQKINLLQLTAQQALAEKKLIFPARENALYLYQQILLIDQTNSAAIRGIQSISNTYIDKVNTSISRGEYQAATSFLATVSVIDPNNPSILLLEKTITKATAIASQKQASERSPSSKINTRQSSKPVVKTSSPNQPKQQSRQNTISDARTSAVQTREQQTIDRQYLQRGLNAYYKGEYETARALLKPLADKGVSRAQFRIGYMYYLGRGYDRDRREADRVIRAALPAIQKFAEEGRAWAQSDLGSLYEDGLVLPRDYAEAVYWYRSAAEQGYPGAQTNLGIMYARGRGVNSSRRTAIQWFQRAAKQGDISAIRNLESMGVDR